MSNYSSFKLVYTHIYMHKWCKHLFVCYSLSSDSRLYICHYCQKSPNLTHHEPTHALHKCPQRHKNENMQTFLPHRHSYRPDLLRGKEYLQKGWDQTTHSITDFPGCNSCCFDGVCTVSALGDDIMCVCVCVRVESCFF